MKTNKLICAMFCICMFFCECMATTQSTIPSSSQSKTQSLINVQRKDNSEPLKIGTIVHYSGTQTIFCVEQVLNNDSFKFLNWKQWNLDTTKRNKPIIYYNLIHDDNLYESNNKQFINDLFNF